MNLFDEEHRAKLFAVVVLIVLILGLIFIYSQSEGDIVVDKQTQCPRDDQYIRDYALVLLDGTDNIVGEYAQELHKEVKAIARKLPQYGKLSMHDVATGKKRFFMMCAPKSPKTGSSLTENLDKLEAVYEKEYLNKVAQAVQAFLDDRNRDQSMSPLLETIANVTALSDFLQTENREFYMFSDMLQNYNEYSHYRGLSPEEFNWLRRQNLYQYIKPQLGGAGVHIYYLLRNRSKHFQSDNHKLFWNSYFRDAAVKNIEWTPINLPSE